MKSIAIAMTRSKSAPIVDPTIAAIFLLLLRPVDGLEGVGEVNDWVCGGVMALEVVGVGETEAVEKGRMAVVLTEDTVLLDVLVADVMGLAVAGFAVTLDAAVPPRPCESVHSMGICPSRSTMLKSLLMNVSGFALKLLKSDTSKWHNQAFPSSRGTRAEPVAETDWLYAIWQH